MIRHSVKTSESWRALPWKKFRRNLFRLQKRVYKAVQVGDKRKARSLQKLILKSTSARFLAIRLVSQLNAGKKTAGNVSQKKTKVTATTDGFDFLGWHFKVQKNGKFKSTPSVDNFKAFRKKVKHIVNNSNYGATTKAEKLAPVVRGWRNYHKFCKMDGSRNSLYHIQKRAYTVFNKETKQTRHSSKKLLDKAFPTVSYSENKHISVKGTKSPYDGDTAYWSERNSKLYDGETSFAAILGQSRWAWVRLAVAQNPSATAETLMQLAGDAVYKIQLAVAKNPETPPDVLAVLEEHQDKTIQAAVAEHPNATEEILHQLFPTQQQLLKKRKNLPMSSKNLADFIKHAVKGSQMPAETLSQLASHTDSSVRYRVASHPNTPATVLRQLARDSYVATVRAVASNANTFPETLEVLASHPDFTTRLEVVRNPNTPPRALAQIVLSTQNSGNTPNQTVDMLKSAFPGDHNDVLRSIAGNPRTPIEALEILARREFIGATPDPRSFIPPTTDDSIVRSLAYNPSLTPQLLGILVQDPCVEVRVCLVRHPNLTEASLRDLVVQPTTRQTSPTLRGLNRLYNPSTDDLVSILAEYASSENAFVRFVTLLHPLTPHEVLTQAAQSASWLERYAVADNSGTPSVLRQQLAEDSNRIVRAAARV